MENPKFKKIITPLFAIQKAEAFCAYQERCQQEVRDKLYALDQDPETVEGIIAQLIENKFLNEERFAMAYVRGKFKQKQWGRIKIKQGLKFKKISDYLIKKALSTIDSDEYVEVIKNVINRKSSDIKENDPYKKRYKIVSHLISRGFEMDIVNDCLDDIYKNN